MVSGLGLIISTMVDGSNDIYTLKSARWSIHSEFKAPVLPPLEESNDVKQNERDIVVPQLSWCVYPGCNVYCVG